MFQRIAEAVAGEFSGHRARNHAIEIHRTDVFSSFSLYRQTARYCLEQMSALGLAGVESLPCRADGRTPYGDWLVPRAWDAREAVLSLVDTGHVLARYPDVPASLVMYSAATPEGGIETELIWVDDLAQVPDDFRGKMVFYDGPVTKWDRRALAQRGIVGLVFCRGKIEFPDQRRWDNYTLAPRNEEGLFGFSLSFREAEHLRPLCRKGPVRVYARVDATLYDGLVENVTATLPGTEQDEEVLVLAHLYETGANDNASGAGAGLEAMRTLKRLIDRGDLPRPRRSIRLLLGFECCGFMGYVTAHPERMRRTVAAINPDMVGEDQELCGSSLGLHLTPGSAPSCVDTLIVHLVEDLVSRRDLLFRWRKEPYAIGDSFVGDPTIGVPSVSLISLPDRFYHSNMDTPDKVSPAGLEQIGRVVATYLYFLANAGPAEAAWLAEQAAVQAHAEIARAAGVVLDRLCERDPAAVAWVAGRLPFLAKRHGQAIASALRFGQDACARIKVKRLQRELERVASAALESIGVAAREWGVELPEPASPIQTDLEIRASGMVPRRRVIGPLTLEPLLLQEPGPFRWEPSWCAPYNQYLLWADGKRSVLDIYCCARWESGRQDVDLQEIVDYMVFLAEHGYLEWV